MKWRAHWTPRYIYDRSRLALHERTHRGAPWLTAEATALLDQLLRPTDVGIEFGSGRSTLWLAERMARLISVEGDRAWHASVSEQITDRGVENVEYLLRVPGVDYADVAERVEARSLDFCLIDGADRDECTARCLPRLSPGAVLVIDNVDRYLPNEPKSHAPNARAPEDGCATPLWQEIWDEISGWRRVWTSNGVTDTAIFFRPC